MKTQILYHVGVDVDDARYKIAVIDHEDKIMETECKPGEAHLIKKIKKMNVPLSEVCVCYEAGYLGYSLQRELAKNGIACQIIAPSQTPEKPGNKVKTDRLDARNLAIYHKKGLLTYVTVPTVQDEAVRAVIRSRKKLQGQIKHMKNRIAGWFRINGIHYQSLTGFKELWTKIHRRWLNQMVCDLINEDLRFDLKRMLHEMSFLESELEIYDEKIEAIAISDRYKESVSRLVCFRGLKVLSAMTLLSEIQDINRFSHPSFLVSYAGMDIIEDSSGGKERKHCMSKMGNRFIRTTLIESAQSAFRIPGVGKQLRQRRSSSPERAIQIADRCMKRLYKKAKMLLINNKSRNKIKGALAREMIGFIWESLRTV